MTRLNNRIVVRIDDEMLLNLEIMNKATNAGKAKIVRMILKDFFDKNDELINEYYEKFKEN
jgi:mannose/cellobiose epimerase-like protein (N-acyl-D-glucosamine 2-epimerase family)